ncbi:MAG: DUF3306 domain-containing protein [Pseudomonadota bacterium]
MAEEGFLKRWSRMKAAGGEVAEAPPRRPAPAPSAAAPAEVAAAVPSAVPASLRTAAPAHEAPPPTLDDVARLTPESDFSAFVAQGVDKSVQRLALKKLFSDPHFRVMDGLDMYMDDYNKPSPMSAAMLAALEHAKSALRPSEPHKPQVAADAADAADAAVAAAPEGAATDEASTPAAEPQGEPVAVDGAVPPAEAACGAVAPPSDPEETDATRASIHAACIQTGAHPQSLQGQA